MRLWWIGLGALPLVAAFSAPSPAQEGPPTWSGEIGPLFRERCAPCHTANGHAPFSLETYQDVVRRSELVRQEVLNRRMPPLTFETDHGRFGEIARLTDEQIVDFQRWVQSGMPEGEALAAPVARAPGFRLGTPDLVLSGAAPDVPTEGNAVWRSVVIDPSFKGPFLLRGFDIVPRSVKSVRHVLLAVASETAKDGATNGTLDGMAARLIGAWGPGYPAFVVPDGVALALQPGEKLVAQVLYQTTGKREDPAIEIGLYAAKPGAKLARWESVERTDFSIPAYGDLSLTTTLKMDRDSSLLAIVPEARFFAYIVEASLGEQTLLRTVQWNPYWPGSFVFSSPVAVPAGATLTSTTVYENELHSPINEGNRPRTVFSGPGLDQEVCRTHYLLVDR